MELTSPRVETDQLKANGVDDLFLRVHATLRKEKIFMRPNLSAGK